MNKVKTKKIRRNFILICETDPYMANTEGKSLKYICRNYFNRILGEKTEKHKE